MTTVAHRIPTTNVTDVPTGLSPETAARLDAIRPHVQGRSAVEVVALVEQAFRNFPGADTDLLVTHLTATRPVGE